MGLLDDVLWNLGPELPTLYGTQFGALFSERMKTAKKERMRRR